MDLLFHIVSAAYAKGTHHKLALDAIDQLRGPDTQRWQRLFLKHAQLYFEGSKAPDDEFKDFKNHVLHPRDNYWGGAPDKARSWYRNLIEALEAQSWSTAVYCAGVLSHYYTDPLQPFHTGQSEAENNIHRAAEWSISKSYETLRSIGEAALGPVTVELPRDPNWLAIMMCRNADKANASYENLIAHYDINRGVVDPPAGLDTIARRLVGELIVYASASFAAVLDRAFEEARVAPPDVALTADMLLSTLKVPVAFVAKRMADAQERKLVERMYDELKATGRVEQNLPEDDRQVRDQHAAEVAALRAKPSVGKVFPFRPHETIVTRVDLERRNRAAAGPAREAEIVAFTGTKGQATPPARAGSLAARLQDRAPTAAVEGERAVPVSAGVARYLAALDSPVAERTPDAVTQVAAEAAAPAVAAAAPPAPVASELPDTTTVEAETGPAPIAAVRPARKATAAGPRTYLTLEQDVVDGPSVGPKTAEKLKAVGIDTVGDLLKAHPIALAARLDTKHITPETITDWQDQARLVCDVPGLRGTHAQLLVGAGYRTADAIADADAERLCADVLAFAASPDGNRVLRDGHPPDIEKIKGWLESARSVKAA